MSFWDNEKNILYTLDARERGHLAIYREKPNFRIKKDADGKLWYEIRLRANNGDTVCRMTMVPEQ